MPCVIKHMQESLNVCQSFFKGGSEPAESHIHMTKLQTAHTRTQGVYNLPKAIKCTSVVSFYLSCVCLGLIPAFVSLMIFVLTLCSGYARNNRGGKKDNLQKEKHTLLIYLISQAG